MRAFLFLLLFIVCTFCTAHAQNISINSYRVYQKAGQIFLADGKAEEKISTGTNDTLPLIIGTEIFYASNNVKNNSNAGVTIIVYNISNKNASDLLRNATDNMDYGFKDPIVNMIFDKESEKLYFSTVSVNQKGSEDFMTWLYDINSKKLSSYKDGIIKSIDKFGNQTIVFYGIDYKGRYSRKNIYTKSGTVNESFDKEYILQGAKN